jgi:hypothetical protein
MEQNGYTGGGCARMTRKIGKEARKEGREYLADRHHPLLFPAVSHGDQAIQESSIIANGGLPTTQTGESEDDDKLPSEEQHMLPLSDDEEGKCPIEITRSVASDEKQISFPARKGSARLPPMEAKSRVQKMPAFDRNYETLSAEELDKFKKQMR